ncbi:MAG: C40 family peptidase [Spirochaetia bacterium]|nr:C40 family peptidase [Spirochaetia bacterium]
MKHLLKSISFVLILNLFLPVNCAEVKVNESDAKPVKHEIYKSKPLKTQTVSVNRGDKILKIAEQFLGLPYKFGGNTPEGFDCSGFTGYVYKKAGIKIPRDTRDQFKALNPVKTPKKGDLVFFKITGNKISHVGIYAGNYKFIHSPRTGKNVEYTDIRIDYWKKRYAGSRTYRM